jgi:hypothetical protein
VTDYKKILAKNVLSLMGRSATLNSHRKLASHCSIGNRKVAPRTIGHLLDPDETRQPQLDTIVAIARAFKVPPWALLSPDFDPVTGNVRELPPPEILDLAYALYDNKDVLQALQKDHQKGQQSQRALHQPAAKPYKPPAIASTK